ncbi:MAG: flagellar export protein FliJ [Kangiella sp.]|nr:MAG: flagellar export protein FliJ [Kangiella sp.]
MTASKRLQPIKKMADKTEKNAAIDLSDSIKDKQDQMNKLSQLIGYRDEYLVKLSEKSQVGVSSGQLQQYHLFLNKLNAAINQQRQSVDISEDNVGQKKGAWQNKNSRAQAIGKVMTNLQSKERLVKDRKEANQLDELTTQAYVRNSKMAV